ncbi:MAG: hypothetical protein GYB64_03895 [Chloroflexi bacterium]|nr:hypothetical protein [Chloroflexota bacterium]
MNFRDYQWSRNPRGLHQRNIGVDINRYVEPRMGWAKFLAGGGEFVRVCGDLVNRGITPIFRIFRPNMGAMRMEQEHYLVYQEYLNAGVRWFELYNEPNLEGEWPQSGGGPTVWVSYENYDECIKPMMDNWLEWAETIIDMGGYPAFPALTESSDHRHSTVFWYREFLNYLADAHYQRAIDVFTNGAWAATHPYLYNHFYQEPPGGPSNQASPYQQQNANEPGWHFEYPYDPLQQRFDPGRTPFGQTALTPNGDTNGLIAAGDVFNRLVREYFGVGPLPVVATEGGPTVPDPSRDDEVFQQDTRYPPYTKQNFDEIIMAMWKWIVEKAPSWFWGMTLWDEPAYYDAFGRVPVIDRMAAEAPLLVNVPSIDTRSGSTFEPRYPVPPNFKRGVGGPPPPEDEEEETPEPPGEPTDPPPPTEPPATPTPFVGPGRVTGEPDYHWLLLAPGLQADWFFHAARRYWQIFRPTVITKWELQPEIPNQRTLAITVLARRDTIDYMDAELRDKWPNVFYDAVVFNTLADMQEELDRRARDRRRFG